MNRFIKKLVITIITTGYAFLTAAPNAMAVVQVDLESGLAISGYNDVRYPGTTGTLISLSQDLTLDNSIFWRVRASLIIRDHHTLSFLAAPLRLDGRGVVQKDVRYGDVVFPALTSVKTRYRFDSYRITYRYGILRRENFHLGIGVTGKIRDAAISIESGSMISEKKNTGFVPLINFRADYNISHRIGLIIDGDALAAPQGRAEDVLAAITVTVAKNAKMKIGYRILEGGADNDEIYTFALVHYLIVGTVWQF